MMRIRLVAATIAVAVVGVSGCSNDEKGLGDAPVGSRHEKPRQVWVSPDEFMNVSAYCIGVNGAYVHTRVAAPVIIVNDPNCVEGGILYEAP